MIARLKSFLSRWFDLGDHKHPIDRIAELNGLLSGIALFPQLVRSLGTPETNGQLSAGTFLLIAVNSAIWIAYAVHRKSPQLLTSGALNLLASSTLLVLALR